EARSPRQGGHRDRHAGADPRRSHPRRRASRNGCQDGRRLLHRRSGADDERAGEAEGPRARGVTASTEPSDDAAEARYLLTPRAIRDRAEALFRLGLEGRLEHFAVDEARLWAVVNRVVAVTRRAYPDISRIPYHARYRHFGAGGVDRLARFDSK